MTRASFLKTAVVGAAAPVLGATANPVAGRALVDTNVWLSQWPTRRSWAQAPLELARRLRGHGVTSAWVGSFDAALHSDIAGLNDRLREACRQDRSGLLVPMGTVNPMLPDWAEDLRRCHELHGMPGIRLMPGYHGYNVDDERFGKLVAMAHERGLLVQVVVSMEDERSQNPLFIAPTIPMAPLVDVLEKLPRARVMLLNGAIRALTGNAALLKRFTARGNLYLETSVLEGVAGIQNLFELAPTVGLTFGSFAPFFYFEAALLKLQESELSLAQLKAVMSENARAAMVAS